MIIMRAPNLLLMTILVLTREFVGTTDGQQLHTTSIETTSSTNANSNLSVPTSAVERFKRELLEFSNKGLATNGLSCAVEFDRHVNVSRDRVKILPPIVIAYILNATSNYARGCLNLPEEALYQIDLIDRYGKQVEKTAIGKTFKPWSEKHIQDWLDEQLRNRTRGAFFTIFPWMSNQIGGGVSLPKVFQLEYPGEYTVHLRMPVISFIRDALGHRIIETTELPEVVAVVQVFTEDITAAHLLRNVQTNSPTK